MLPSSIPTVSSNDVQAKAKGMRLSKKLMIIGVVVCLSGVALGWGILPSFVKNSINKSKGLYPGSDIRKIWEKLPFPMTFKAHIFNITNPEAVQAGDTPMLDEIGPFYFENWKEKVDITDDEVNDTVTFYMKDTWIFDQKRSAPLTGYEIVYVPHVALLGAAMSAERDKPALLKILAKALPGLFNDPSSVILRTTVMDFLFAGNVINCTSSEFAVKAVCGVMKKSGAFVEGNEPNTFLFSVFGKKNATRGIGEYKVKRGIVRAADVGQMVTYMGAQTQTVWSGLPCNSITGTDATIFPPFLDKSPLLSFAPDFCRSMSAVFKGVSLYKGIPTFEYTSSFGDMSSNRDEKCFCPAVDKCLKRGVLDLFKCQGVPIVASLPHFFDADEEYVKDVRGLHPDGQLHGISVQLEPLTGTPMVARKRAQFSLPIHQVNNINITNNLTDCLVPFLWVEEGMELSDLILAELDSKLFKVLRGIDVMKWVTTVVGAGIALAGGILNCMNPFSSKMDSQAAPQNKIFTLSS